MKPRTPGALVVVEGLDGSGKSTAAQQAARNLSEIYSRTRIGVADSTGLYSYVAGELVEHKYSHVVDLEPRSGDNKLETISRLGAFTLARKFVDFRGLRRSDVLLSVRDPHRVDPAIYSAVYSPNIFGRFSSHSRLSFFDKLTKSSYPEMIIQLNADPSTIMIDTGQRDTIDPHETIEKLTAVAEELPVVLNAFKKLFDKPVHEVAALEPSTADNVTLLVEPLAMLQAREVA